MTHLWEVKSLLFSSMQREVSITLDLRESTWCTQRGFLLKGLRTGFYPGGRSHMQLVYRLICESAAVPGVWIRRSRTSGWDLNMVGDVSGALREDLWDYYQANAVAAKLAGDDPNYYYWLALPKTSHWYYLRSPAFRNVARVRELVAKHIDDRYRKRVEPFVKRVENGKLILRGGDYDWRVE